jgi:cation diffusion facilitator CzcD-associated flavoprotein CzcO
MHNRHVLAYFREYVRHFDLHKYIQFGVHVRSVQQHVDDDGGTVWNVCWYVHMEGTSE